MLINLGLTLIKIHRERWEEKRGRGGGGATETQKGREASERIRTGIVTPAASLIAVSFDP